MSKLGDFVHGVLNRATDYEFEHEGKTVSIKGKSLTEAFTETVSEYFAPSAMTKEQLFDWAYNSHLVGADKEAAIKRYEAAR